MKAIILAGGLGTRLRSVVSDVPKVMAPLADERPFLSYLIEYLKHQGITEVILSVCFLRELIQAYFRDNYHGLPIHYAVESTPLGTGGAIRKALSLTESNEPIFVLNGDTFLKMNYRAMYDLHARSSTSITMALRKIDDCERYGSVMTHQDKVIGFIEKGIKRAGLINAGVYLVKPTLFQESVFAGSENPFSFETDFLVPSIQRLKPSAFVTEDYFIDIGIPEDYERAKQECVGWNN